MTSLPARAMRRRGVNRRGAGSGFAGAVCTWLTLAAAGILPAATLSPVQITGSTDKRINIVILSEGYTQSDLAGFPADAQGLMDHLFGEEPFQTYINYFNIYRLEVASSQSGADVPQNQIQVNTAFDATFGNPPLERLLTVSTSKVSTALSANAPFYDIGLVLVNSGIYGGSGGQFAVSSKHSQAPEIAAHELGHSFAGLADEYESAGGSPYEAPNATAQTNPALVKWNLWFDPGTPIPTPDTTNAYDGLVGLFEGAVYRATGWYRPHYRSKMRALGRPWGQVNSERLIRTVYQLVPPFHGRAPAAPVLPVNLPGALEFQAIEVMQPVGHALEIAWKIDGVIRGESGATLAMHSSELVNGAHTVEVNVRDTTPMVRNQSGYLLEKTESWTLDVTNHLRFDEWIAAQFPGEPALQPPQLDVEGDGLNNFAEFVLAGNPSWEDADALQPQGGLEGELLWIEFTRELNRVGAAIVVEATGDLENWVEIARSENSKPFTGTALVTETPVGAGRTQVRVRDTETPPPGPGGRRYLRAGFFMLPGF